MNAKKGFLTTTNGTIFQNGISLTQYWELNMSQDKIYYHKQLINIKNVHIEKIRC